jgi:uncharacterized protein
MNGRYIAYDSESSAIHELDQLAFDVINLFIERDGVAPDQQALQELSDEKGFSIDELRSCTEDFLALIDTGSLFAGEPEVSLSNLYPEEPMIKAMCLHICHDCNLRCQYCFAGTGDYGTGTRSMLNEKTGKLAIDFLIAASGSRRNLDIDFFGGEPLMNWPVVVALTEYSEKRSKETGKDIRLTITTNAVLLDEEKTKFINQHMRNCVLSIDGRPEVHDLMRPNAGGKPSYDVVSSRIRTFLASRNAPEAAFHEHYVRGTYTRHNLDFSKDVRHMAEVLGARHISIEPVVAPDSADYSIRLSDLPEIEKEYENLAEYLLNEKKSDDPVHFFHFIMDMQSGPCVYKRLKGCGVGAEYCAVTPNGDIYPCHQFAGEEKWLMGNVHDLEALISEKGTKLARTDVMQILNTDKRKTFIDRLMPNKPECKTCFARYHCGGGCPANSYHATGSLDGQYEIGCRLAKKRLECSLWLTVSQQDPSDMLE